jgi:hypothetical protein
MTCQHTYLRWALNDKATCAVCAFEFSGYEYDPKFVGTFPREDYEKDRQQRHLYGVNTTTTISPMIRFGLDDESL